MGFAFLLKAHALMGSSASQPKKKRFTYRSLKSSLPAMRHAA